MRHDDEGDPLWPEPPPNSDFFEVDEYGEYGEDGDAYFNFPVPGAYVLKWRLDQVPEMAKPMVAGVAILEYMDLQSRWTKINLYYHDRARSRFEAWKRCIKAHRMAEKYESMTHYWSGWPYWEYDEEPPADEPKKEE